MLVRQLIFRGRSKVIILALAVCVALGALGLFYMQLARAAAVGGFLVYSNNTTTPQKREWMSGTSFEGAAATTSSRNPYQTVTKVSPAANSIRVMGILDSGGTLQVLRSTDNGQSWVSGFTASLGGTGTTRRFDIAFEQSSGEIVVAYSKNATTNEIGVRRYNGSWQAEVTYNPTGTANVVTWIELAEKSGSDELAIGYVTNATSNNIGAGIWNGSTNAPGNWTASSFGTCDQTTGPNGADKCMDVNYETNSGFPVMSWGISSTGNTTFTMRATRWNGSSWSTATINLGANSDDGTYVDCEANPQSTSNEIACGSYGASVATVQMWVISAGTLVSGTAAPNKDDTAHAASAGKSFVATTYVVSGSTVRAVVAWADLSITGGANTDNQIDYVVFNGTSWDSVSTFSKTFGDDENLLAVANPVDSSEAMFVISDENADLWAAKISLSGSTLTWSNADGGSALETSLGNIVGRAYDFAYNPAASAPTLTQSAYRWYANADNVTPGSALANESTAHTLTSLASPIRLRLQLDVSADNLLTASQAFALQYATSTSGPWTTTGSGGWWDSNWGARRKITFDNSASASNLTDFPVRVSLSSSNIDYSKTQNAGQDIRFVDGDGTVLKHEIENWNEAGTSEVWVKVPQIDAGSTTDAIWMYYDNNSASDGQDTAGTWNTNYKAVWHLKENPTGTAPQMADSTGVNNGTTSGMASGDSITGQIYNALNFDATNNSVDAGNNSSLNITSNTMTTSMWIKRATSSAIGYLVTRGVAGTSGYGFGIGSSDSSGCGVNTIQASKMGVVHACVGAVPADTNWHFISVVWSGSGATAYIDGDASTPTNANTTNIITSTTNLKIGSDSAGGQVFNGGIDELTISSTARSADWIKATYKTQALTFNSYGSEETYADPTFTFYDNPTPVSGADITTSYLLTGTDVRGTYQENNPTPANPYAVYNSQQAEWDFALDPAGAADGTTYYFRLAKPDGSALNTPLVYPQLTISLSTGPTLDQQMRGGQSVVNGVKQPFSF